MNAARSPALTQHREQEDRAEPKSRGGRGFVAAISVKRHAMCNTPGSLAVRVRGWPRWALPIGAIGGVSAGHLLTLDAPSPKAGILQMDQEKKYFCNTSVLF